MIASNEKSVKFINIQIDPHTLNRVLPVIYDRA